MWHPGQEPCIMYSIEIFVSNPIEFLRARGAEQGWACVPCWAGVRGARSLNSGFPRERGRRGRRRWCGAAERLKWDEGESTSRNGFQMTPTLWAHHRIGRTQFIKHYPPPARWISLLIKYFKGKCHSGNIIRSEDSLHKYLKEQKKMLFGQLASRIGLWMLLNYNPE